MLRVCIIDGGMNGGTGPVSGPHFCSGIVRRSGVVQAVLCRANLPISRLLTLFIKIVKTSGWQLPAFGITTNHCQQGALGTFLLTIRGTVIEASNRQSGQDEQKRGSICLPAAW